MLSQPTINLLYVFGRTEQIRILGLKQTKSDKTNTLDIFGSFILSVKGQNMNLGICRHSCKRLKEQTKVTNILVSFSIKVRIYI